MFKVSKAPIFIFISIFISLFFMVTTASFAMEVQKVNINTATVKELTQLKGVGESLAKRIVEYREKTSQFKTPNDITKVKGIGKAIFEKNKGIIEISSKKE